MKMPRWGWHHRGRDGLTGLLTGDRFDEALGAAIAEGGELAVVVLELDRSLVKSGLGRSAGAALLHAAAARLDAVVPDGAAVARLHGDEFGIVVRGDSARAADRAEALRVALAEPFSIGGCRVSAAASIGVARYPADGGDAQVLVDSADRAMELAKQQGGNRVAFHAPGLRTRAIDRLEVEAALRSAVDHGGLSVAYQPRVDVRTGEVWGAEALLRWRDETLGDVPPTTFVPIAEETGLIAPIGEWVVEQAARQLRHWDDAGLPAVAVSVNVSARQFGLYPLVEGIARALDGAGVAPERLEVELTESAALQDADTVSVALRQLRELGVGCAIDDFGTGYSCLRTLSRMPFSALKIDRAFVQEIHGDGGDAGRASVVLAVLDLARSLGLRAVAEGVETDDQLDFLRRHGCDEAQGYLFSPALTPAAFESLVAARRPEVDSVEIDLRVPGDARIVLPR